MPKFDPDRTLLFKKTSHPDLVNSLITPYQIIINLADERQIFIDRFSVGVLKNLRILSVPDAKVILRCGAFCEIANDAQILIGGNHSNADLINFTFGSIGVAYQAIMRREEIASFFPYARAIEIGHNVTVSSKALVLDGAKIGQGAVIGAGCVVRGEIEGFGIYLGSPAKLVKYRFGPEKIADYMSVKIPDVRPHCIPLLAELKNTKNVRDVIKSIEYMNGKPAIVFRGTLDSNRNVCLVERTGFMFGGELIKNPTLVEGLSSYFDQAYDSSENLIWSPDIFFKLGVRD